VPSSFSLIQLIQLSSLNRPLSLSLCCSYKLNIINLVKSDSLYTSGMQPLLHSQLLHRRKGLGWHRAGSSVAYMANSVKRAGAEHYHSISIVLEGLQEGDVVHLAHCYPFTYTDLQRHLHVLMVGKESGGPAPACMWAHETWPGPAQPDWPAPAAAGWPNHQLDLQVPWSSCLQ
jgi:hypothetical protein